MAEEPRGFILYSTELRAIQTESQNSLPVFPAITLDITNNLATFGVVTPTVADRKSSNMSNASLPKFLDKLNPVSNTSLTKPGGNTWDRSGSGASLEKVAREATDLKWWERLKVEKGRGTFRPAITSRENSPCSSGHHIS